LFVILLEKRLLKKLKYILFFTLLSFKPIIADYEGYSNLWIGSSNNAFYLDSAGNTLISGAGIGFRFFKENSNFSSSAELNFTDYISFTERNFLNLSTGIYYSKALDYPAKNFFSFTGNLNCRIGSADIDIYNYIQPLIQGNYTHNFSDNTYIQASYSPRMRFYMNYPEINYFENSISGNFRTLFDTKTTLFVSTSYLQKNYINSSINTMGNMTSAKSKSKNENFIQKKYKWGKIIGNNKIKEIVTNVNTIQMSGYSPSQISGSIKVGQNISENFGISLNISLSSSLNSISKDSLQGISYFSGDMELFDDSYSYENLSISPTITYILPFEIISKLSYFNSEKQYNYFAELADGNQSQRKDSYRFISFSLEKSFYFDTSFINQMILNFEYNFYNNKSNSYLFNYESQDLSLSLQINF
jgi:hypothetical protein